MLTLSISVGPLIQGLSNSLVPVSRAVGVSHNVELTLSPTAAPVTPDAAGAWQRPTWVRHHGLAVCSPHPWASVKRAYSLGAPSDFSKPAWKSDFAFFHVVVALVFTAYLCYSHLHVHEHSTRFTSLCGCFTS